MAKSYPLKQAVEMRRYGSLINIKPSGLQLLVTIFHPTEKFAVIKAERKHKLAYSFFCLLLSGQTQLAWRLQRGKC